jgi:hypothetical protein
MGDDLKRNGLTLMLGRIRVAHFLQRGLKILNDFVDIDDPVSYRHRFSVQQVPHFTPQLIPQADRPIQPTQIRLWQRANLFTFVFAEWHQHCVTSLAAKYRRRANRSAAVKIRDRPDRIGLTAFVMTAR